jgi:hypothetical protein
VAKTVLTYMISSAFGNLKEVVKFVPVNKIKGTEITKITKQIINFVQDCGFEVLCVITDNHSINRAMFKTLSFKIANPKSPEKTIFLTYDLVHIFKNIWKYWLNLKNLDHTIVFYDWEDLETIRYPNFKIFETFIIQNKIHLLNKPLNFVTSHCIHLFWIGRRLFWQIIFFTVLQYLA